MAFVIEHLYWNSIETQYIHSFPFLELRNVLPGKYEQSAIKIASKAQDTSDQHTFNLMLVTSVVTPKRTYNFQWHSFEDMRGFFAMVEAIMGVTIYKVWYSRKGQG